MDSQLPPFLMKFSGGPESLPLDLTREGRLMLGWGAGGTELGPQLQIHLLSEGGGKRRELGLQCPGF